MPKWRPFSWVILVINLLFLIWIIVGIAGSGGTPKDCGTLSAQTCNDAQSVGTAVGVGIIIFLWALVDIILGVIWVVTRPRNRRTCPSCGTEAKAGVTVCKKCGYNFQAAAGGSPASPTPPTPPMPPSP